MAHSVAIHNWNEVLMKNINSIINEVKPYSNIMQFMPVPLQHESIIEYNEKLLSFKRLYSDTYRFLNTYVIANCSEIMSDFTALLPRHYYWKINMEQLNMIILYMNNRSDKELAKYMVDIGYMVFRDKYITILATEKMNYINLKRDMSCH